VPEPAADDHPGSNGVRATPDWLLLAAPRQAGCRSSGKRRKRSYVDKTLAALASLVQDTLLSEEIAARPGLLQALDPRCKLLGMLLLLVATSLVHNVITLVVMYAATLVLAWACSVHILFFLKRVWLFIPLFTLVIVFPATLSVVMPGHVVLTLWRSGGKPEGFTSQGISSALLVTGRVTVSVSLVLLVTLTTSWARLLASLRAIGVPRMFVLVIGMCYRYIFLLAGSVSEMYEARRSRTIRADRGDRRARRFVASTAGALLAKATYLSEEVHEAMVSRGYRGDPKLLQAFRLCRRDIVCLSSAVAFAGLAVGVDAFVGR
jgi:cobalt ECF transporter T component CbiQ